MVWAIQTHGKPDQGILTQHMSIGGIVSGINQWIYGLTFHTTIIRRKLGIMREIFIPPPNIWIMLGVAALIMVAGIAAARARIRAVEVVRG